jgi:hypothetical protein
MDHTQSESPTPAPIRLGRRNARNEGALDFPCSDGRPPIPVWPHRPEMVASLSKSMVGHPYPLLVFPMDRPPKQKWLALISKLVVKLH